MATEEQGSVRSLLRRLVDSQITDNLVMGGTAIAVFALIITLIVYAAFSWIDVYEIGMRQREQVLYIALPLILALALLPATVQGFFKAVATLDELRKESSQ